MKRTKPSVVDVLLFFSVRFFSSYVTGLFGGIKLFIINPIQNRFPKVTWFLFFSFHDE